ncbi:MAG: class I SAM-dependent rRNA methyltransferase [Pseudomonadota bacterium]|nr:class I SAM-dependent rRNA methyltransferase [Pseudomonadota bacterium]
MNTPDTLPLIRLLPSRHKRVVAGHPWVYSNEIAMDAAAKALAPGSPVRIHTSQDTFAGTGFFNPHTLIAGRILTRDPGQSADRGFLARKLQAALALRQRLFPRPFYRLVHAEADGLPGLVIDRYDRTVVVQANTAGMDRLLPDLLVALDEVVSPGTIVLRNDSPVRTLEGLPLESRVVKGQADGLLELEENGVRFVVQPAGGQKTGWFYDHRDNRAFMARLAQGARVLDVYTYAGGFGIQCAAAGATSILAVDRSQPALDLATQAATLNNVSGKCTFRQAEVFEELERLKTAKEKFDVVIADPPAFVKSRKDIPAGSRAYRKLARMAAEVTAPGGFLLVASCSHNMESETFLDMAARGLADAGREGRIIRSAGAGPDHPVHPLLPETAYLKALVFRLD